MCCCYGRFSDDASSLVRFEPFEEVTQACAINPVPVRYVVQRLVFFITSILLKSFHIA